MGEKTRKHESREFLAARRKAIMEKANQRRKEPSSPRRRGETVLPPFRAPLPPPPGSV
jgi:hypothetical protein